MAEDRENDDQEQISDDMVGKASEENEEFEDADESDEGDQDENEEDVDA